MDSLTEFLAEIFDNATDKAEVAILAATHRTQIETYCARMRLPLNAFLEQLMICCPVQKGESCE